MRQRAKQTLKMKSNLKHNKITEPITNKEVGLDRLKIHYNRLQIWTRGV